MNTEHIIIGALVLIAIYLLYDQYSHFADIGYAMTWVTGQPVRAHEERHVLEGTDPTATPQNILKGQADFVMIEATQKP